ncbi:hypothetical protein J4423_01295 [Candidatus Pacearchaeota archaeon]|nr:hypothetical protein [Candidatus Pacearchaeota archaeon]
MGYFWGDWKLSKLEKEGAKSILYAKKLILEHIPHEEIMAIYVKGSFVRREMNIYSDVDTFTVLKHSKYVSRMKNLEKKYRKAIHPPIQLSSMSLWELKNNKRAKLRRGIGTSPAAISNHLKHYKLIYGKEINTLNFEMGSSKGRLRGMMEIFNEMFLPQYEEGKLHKHELIKQIFWLVEREQVFLGKEPPHSWRGLAKMIKDKNHIIQDTKRLYFDKKTKSHEEMEKLIKKLKIYLKRLEKQVT